MASDADPRPGRSLTGGQADTLVYRDSAQKAADRAVLGGAHTDHSLADEIAAKTETPREAAIDAANGLRGESGRRPVPEDFEGILTPAGNSGDVVGSDVTEGSAFVFGEDGATKGTLQDGG